MANELARHGAASVENISGTGPSGAGARLGVQDEDPIGPVLAARSQCIRCFWVRTVQPGTAPAYPSPARAHTTSLWRICISCKANLNSLGRTLKRTSTTPSQWDHISRRGKPPRSDDRNNMQDTEKGHRRAPAASAPVDGRSATGACSQGCGRKKKSGSGGRAHLHSAVNPGVVMCSSRQISARPFPGNTFGQNMRLSLRQALKSTVLSLMSSAFSMSMRNRAALQSYWICTPARQTAHEIHTWTLISRTTSSPALPAFETANSSFIRWLA